MDVHKKDLAARLKAARERAHISVDDAASAAGVQPIAIRRWEKGTALPSLLEFRQLLQAYGVMACDVLFDENPLTLTPSQAAELSQAARHFSPSLRLRMDLLLTMHGRGVEPVWKTA
jgi:transcriptional regulator with XRE-family HTH domain